MAEKYPWRYPSNEMNISAEKMKLVRGRIDQVEESGTNSRVGFLATSNLISLPLCKNYPRCPEIASTVPGFIDTQHKRCGLFSLLLSTGKRAPFAFKWQIFPRFRENQLFIRVTHLFDGKVTTFPGTSMNTSTDDQDEYRRVVSLSSTCP